MTWGGHGTKHAEGSPRAPNDQIRRRVALQHRGKRETAALRVSGTERSKGCGPGSHVASGTTTIAGIAAYRRHGRSRSRLYLALSLWSAVPAPLVAERHSDDREELPAHLRWAHNT